MSAGARAWGDEGHKIIALIADQYLRPEVRERVESLLATDRTGLTANRGIAAESTWADRYRALHRDTADWHYTNIEIDNSRPEHGQLLAKIDQFRAELADPAASPGEHLMALQFLLHLVGDLHQPLHAADNHDHGGNELQVLAPGERRGNLHHYWDNVFVRNLGDNAQAVSRQLIAGITPAVRAAAARGTPASWAMESFAIARVEAYGKLPPAGPDGVHLLDERYVREATMTVQLQLQRAGLRLAQVLNEGLR
jgi:hypothetical protein